MSSSCSEIHTPGSRSRTISFRRAARSRRSSGSIVSARWMVSACSWMSNGFTESGVRAELLVRARVLGEHHDPVSGVDRRRLLRHEVHAVEDRVDHQQVEVLVARDRLGKVLVDPQVDGHPVRGPVAVVDDRDQRLDPLQVLGVLRHILARGLQVGDERTRSRNSGCCWRKTSNEVKPRSTFFDRSARSTRRIMWSRRRRSSSRSYSATSGEPAARSSRPASIPSG